MVFTSNSPPNAWPVAAKRCMATPHPLLSPVSESNVCHTTANSPFGKTATCEELCVLDTLVFTTNSAPLCGAWLNGVPSLLKIRPMIEDPEPSCDESVEVHVITNVPLFSDCTVISFCVLVSVVFAT